jgi:hypothetical protein
MIELPLETLIAFLLLLIVAGIAVWFFVGRYKDERRAQLKRETDAWIDRLAAHGFVPISTRLILKGDEHAILEEEATLFESRAYRLYGGGGTRIGRFSVGGGVSESQQRVKQIDQGILTLTTKRLIFDGSTENRNVQLSQVMSVSPGVDAIEISTERRAKSQIYSVANPLLWATVIKTFAGMRARGASLDLRFCAECRRPLPSGSSRCPHCHVRV